MVLFIISLTFTLATSAFCSLLEAMFLSLSQTESELLRKRSPRAADLLVECRARVDETISSVLTLNTIANTLGAVVTGTLAANLFTGATLFMVPIFLTAAILIFSEIIPKNLGVAYRTSLVTTLIFPLSWICRVLRPVTYFSGKLVAFIIRKAPDASNVEEEIAALVERGAKEGELAGSEKRLVMNALAMHDVLVEKVMTPRIVVTAFDEDMTVADVLRDYRTIPFGKIPVFKETIDQITGVVRRRDILHSASHGEKDRTVGSLAITAEFVPETMRLQGALTQLLDAHQSLAIVVDEFGGSSGVVTIEDILEFLIGREVYELDDPAVDMQQLARKRARVPRMRATEDEKD